MTENAEQICTEKAFFATAFIWYDERRRSNPRSRDEHIGSSTCRPRRGLLRSYSLRRLRHETRDNQNRSDTAALRSRSEFRNQHLRGLQLAIEELNASNPTVVFELVVASDQNDPGAALAAFKDQLLKKKILVSFVVTRSSCLAVVPQAENEFVPVFANCKHPLITTMHANTFRIVPSTTLEIRTTARFLAESLKADGAAVLYFNDDDGNDAAKAFKRDLPQAGIRLLAAEPFIDDAASIKSAVSVALAQDPNAVYVFGAGKAAAGVLAGLRAAGYRGAVVGSSDFRDPAFAALAGKSLEVLLLRSRDRALGKRGFRRPVPEEIQRGAGGQRRLRI